MGKLGQKLSEEQRKRISDGHKGQKAWNKGKGISHRPLATVWKDMMRRCNNTNRHEYKNYGGRGICVDSSWSDYYQFEKDMLGTYAKGLTLDRIDNDGNYSKSNCRWVSRADQNRNTRRNIRIVYKGVSDTVRNWVTFFNIKRSTFEMRLFYGWDLEKALTTPTKERRIKK